MFDKLHKLAKDYVQKELIKDKFDGIYPFDLNNSANFKYKSFGEKNPDKIFYVIYRTPYEAGFFSNYIHVLYHLKLIENTDLIPVVDFENFKTFYNTTNPIEGTKNSWEYYFEQPAGYSLEEVYQSKNVLFCDGKFPHQVGSKFSSEEVTKYFNKYFNLKPHIKEIIAPYKKLFDGKRVLGVHFRGKDLNIFPGHPFGATEEQMFRYTDEIIKKYDIDKIFLATDEEKYLKAYIERYSDKVFYADIFRTEKINEFNINPRENHRYLLGAEVILDAVLLSFCNGLLRGPSGVACTAQHLNHDFEFVYKIYNGKNSNNRYKARFLFEIKKHLPKKLGGLLDQVEITVKDKD